MSKVVRTKAVDGVIHAVSPDDPMLSATKEGRVFSHYGGKIKEVGHFCARYKRYKVGIVLDGKHTVRFRSRIVLSCWDGVSIKENTKLHVLHNDGVASNDSVENLRWGSHSDNMRDAARHGRNGRQKLTYQQCRDICNSTASSAELAKMYGVRQGTINKIRAKGLEYFEKTEFEASEVV